MEILAGLSATGVLIFLILLVLLGILLPVSAYSAQKRANKTYKETREINKKLEEILSLARTRSGSSASVSRGHEEKLGS